MAIKWSPEALKVIGGGKLNPQNWEQLLQPPMGSNIRSLKITDDFRCSNSLRRLNKNFPAPSGPLALLSPAAGNAHPFAEYGYSEAPAVGNPTLVRGYANRQRVAGINTAIPHRVAGA